MRRWLLALLIAAAVEIAPARAHAEPFQLRADAFVYSQGSGSPTGYVALSGEDKLTPWAETEAVLWAGNGATADALVFMVKLRHPKNWGELRLGRQIISAGAVRPIHIDGADGRVRLPTGTSFEVFGGVPVVPEFQYGAYDWVAGGRAAQALGRNTTIGVSYLQQRDDGALAYEEVGMDFASAPTRWFDVASHAAYDLIDPGLSEARVSLAGRLGPLRPELFALHRSPSRLLPATSLFSALGDMASDSAGLTLLWKMFPRLDVLPILAARTQDGDAGIDATLRTTLRLDDRGRGAIVLDLRRQGSGLDPWSGVRLAVRVPLTERWLVSTELELVVPDNDNPDPAVRAVQRARGTVWPWSLVALRWAPIRHWEVAGAVESASTPTSTFEVNALMRLSASWGGGT
ncbi:MAG TPA: hypothetical protein VLM85_32850 [Polyangiaceae bacterium]|nr:hypothetical protein [Polyangiaceae bacterium]